MQRLKLLINIFHSKVLNCHPNTSYHLNISTISAYYTYYFNPYLNINIGRVVMFANVTTLPSLCFNTRVAKLNLHI